MKLPKIIVGVIVVAALVAASQNWSEVTAYLGGPLLGVLGFLAILAPLVIVHEFGHFLFAKAFNVKILAFSVGFGPRIFYKKVGETEWRVSAIPLGGYVKLLGEDPEEELSEADKKRALNNQEPWKRFFVYFGGPLFNFIWAALVFMLILVIGEPQTASTLSRIQDGSQAAKAGLMSGDRVLSIDGKEVSRRFDMAVAIRENPSRTVEFRVQRQGVAEPILLNVPISSEENFSIYGEFKQVGVLDGFEPLPRSTTVGISSPNSEAGKAGVATGDTVVSFNGQEVSRWERLIQVYREAPAGQRVDIKFKRKESEQEYSAQFTKEAGQLYPGSDWGLYSSELFVKEAVKDSPAFASGIRDGDRLASIDGKPIMSFLELTKAINRSAKENGQVKVAWERDGKTFIKDITPKENRERGVMLDEVTRYTIGVAPLAVYSKPETVLVQIWNPFLLLYNGVKRMAEFSYLNVVTIGKMIVGDVSIAVMGGPFAIGKIAGESIEMGLITFLTRMAQLSVGLAILNILPIPVLDGGHILLLGIEAVRRKPLTLRQLSIIHQVGFLLIISLMVFVIKNDIVRMIPLD